MTRPWWDIEKYVSENKHISTGIQSSLVIHYDATTCNHVPIRYNILHRESQILFDYYTGIGASDVINYCRKSIHTFFYENHIFNDSKPRLSGECLCDKTIDHCPGVLIFLEHQDLIDNTP